MFPHSCLRNSRYLLCSRTLGTQGLFALKVTSDLPSDLQVSLFTVFPHPGLPKYRYLQCSRTLASASITIYNVPGPWAHEGCSPSKLPVISPVIPKYRYLQCSRTLGSPSIAIYGVPALLPPQVSLFTVFSHPGHTRVARPHSYQSSPL